MNKQTYLVLFGLLALIQLAGCVTSKPVQKSPRERLTELQAMLQRSPSNPTLLCDAGVAHFELNEYPQAEQYLQKARVISTVDPRIALYLGLVFEATDRTDNALAIYKDYNQYNGKSVYSKLLFGRFLQINRAKLRSQLAELAEKERNGDLTRGRLSAEAVAVFPFNYLGGNKQYEPLGRGIAALMVTDLGLIRGLKVLERDRLQVLLDEIAQGQSNYIDKDSAPQAGRILGAGRVIAGNFQVPNGQKITIDTQINDLSNSNFTPVTETELLSKLFEVEKRVVFGVVERLGIQISPEERQNIIGKIPTQNFDAFLAYCRGMEADDNGRIPDAIRNYRRAVELDPNFKKPQENLEAAKAREAAGSTWQQVNFNYNWDTSGFGGNNFSTDFLLNDRLRLQGAGIGTGIVPNDERRKPVEESGGKRTLPNPPDNPIRGGN
jgi:tetratricopeptide (TPR) repeat protein